MQETVISKDQKTIYTTNKLSTAATRHNTSCSDDKSSENKERFGISIKIFHFEKFKDNHSLGPLIREASPKPLQMK